MSYILAVYRKNRTTIKRAYPWSIMLGWYFEGTCSILFPILIYSFMFEGKLGGQFETFAQTTNYITYVTLGVICALLSTTILFNVSRGAITEVREGTLDAFLISPCPRIPYFIGVFFEQLTRSLITIVPVLILGAIWGARVPLETLPASLLVLILLLLANFALATSISTLMLFTRDTYIVQNTIFVAMDLVCGVVFPLGYLPLPIQYFAQIFPLTPALELMRAVILRGEPIGDNWILAVQLLVSSIAYFTIGIYTFKRMEKRLVEKILA